MGLCQEPMEEENHLYIWTILFVVMLWILVRPEEKEGFIGAIRSGIGAGLSAVSKRVASVKNAVKGGNLFKSGSQQGVKQVDNVAEGAAKSGISKLEVAGMAGVSALGFVPLMLMGGSAGGPGVGENGAPLTKAQTDAMNQSMVLLFVCIICCCCCSSISSVLVVSMS